MNNFPWSIVPFTFFTFFAGYQIGWLICFSIMDKKCEALATKLADQRKTFEAMLETAIK